MKKDSFRRLIGGFAILIAASSAEAQVFNCGGLGQRYCQPAWYMNDSVITGDPYCNEGLTIAGGTCVLDRSGWVTKALDMTREGVVAGIPCGGSRSISCWRVDDETRDHLTMDTSSLNYVSEITPGGQAPASGRFIFVYRPSDNKLLIRRYDRAHTEGDPELTACLGYAQYRFPGNQRQQEYLHVRHSQLNGGWGPVYCAGEITFKGGAVWRLNNASGHYQPSATCLNYVETTLKLYGYPLHQDYQKGPYNVVHATETSCPAPVSPDPGPDDQEHDEL